MTGLAYALPPVSGLIAYLFGASARSRFHGLQSIVIGVVWPASLFVASWLSSALTRSVGAIGVLLLLVLIVATASGRDFVLPVVGRPLQLAAATSPRRDGAIDD